MRWLRARTGGVMPWLAVGTLLGVLFVTAPAAADLPSPDRDAKPVAAAASANPAETTQLPEAEAPPVVTPAGHKKRPVFMALLAVGFLIFAGVVGANDKAEGDKPKAAV